MGRLTASLVLICAAACGDDGGGKTTDAGTSDVLDIDAAPSDVPVTLTITSNGTAIAGVRVHFQNADFTLIESTDTNASGVATAIMPFGGYVTAINPNSGAPGGATAYIKTFGGVKPGDELVLKDDFENGGIDLQVTAPADGGGTVNNYYFGTPCNTAESGTVLSPMFAVGTACATTSDILVASRNSTDVVLNWAYAPNTATASGTVVLTDSTLTAAVSKTFNYTNIPVANQGANFAAEYHSDEGKLIEIAGGDLGTSVSEAVMVTPFTDAREVVLGLTGGPYAFNNFVDWGPYTATAYTIDVGARQIRPATSGAAFDVATHSIKWTESTAGVAPDFAMGGMQGFRESGLYIYWDVVAPHASGELVFPTLPVETTDYNFAATDILEYQGVTLAKVPGGYDAVREQVLLGTNPIALVAGASGSITFAEIDPAGGTAQGKRRLPLPGANRQRLTKWGTRLPR